MPPLSPHVPLARHLRHILPLLTLSGTSATHNTYTSDINTHVTSAFDLNNEGDTDKVGPEEHRRYTAAVDQATYSEQELSETEFEEAMEAAGFLEGV